MAIDISREALEQNEAYQKIQRLNVTYQKYLDQSVPYTTRRWVGFGVLLSLFFLRVIFAQGWYIICYGLSIYLLNLFLAFLTPKFDPSLEQEMKNETMEEGFQEGVSSREEEDEFKPFIRRLPEFKFWHNATRAVIISLFLTFWSFFDIPVFWPILLMYFIILFALTMRKQIQHMVKYRYLPFDFGKVKYRSSR